MNEPAPATRDAPTRGSAAARAALTGDDELGIVTVIVTRFFRPTGGQARWIDPRPLGDVRGAADSAATPDDAWAAAVRTSIAQPRVCVYPDDPDDADDACRGRRGGVLRFSHPYADGDGARVFVRWTPTRGEGAIPELGQPAFEMVFTMERISTHGWRIVNQRAVNPI